MEAACVGQEWHVTWELDADSDPGQVEISAAYYQASSWNWTPAPDVCGDQVIPSATLSCAAQWQYISFRVRTFDGDGALVDCRQVGGYAEWGTSSCAHEDNLTPECSP